MGLPKVPQRIGPGFAFSMVGRCLQEGLGTRKFGAAEIAQVLAFFGADPPECVYCGSHEVQRWDHLVAVREGGETVLGNMVPACARCDDARRAHPFEEWMVGPAQWSPMTRGVADVDRRMGRIRAYAPHFGYVPRALEERLDERELERLIAIRERLGDLRTDIEALVEDYKARTGG